MLVSIYKQSNFLNIIKLDNKQEIICYNSLYGAGKLHLLYKEKCIVSEKSNDFLKLIHIT